MTFKSLRQFYNRLFRTKDKYIEERKRKMEASMIYTEEELRKAKEKDEVEYIYFMNLNKINRVIIDNFILELNKKFYGK